MPRSPWLSTVRQLRGALEPERRDLFSSREENRPNLRTGSAAALDSASREGIELTDYIAGAATCMSHEAL